MSRLRRLPGALSAFFVFLAFYGAMELAMRSPLGQFGPGSRKELESDRMVVLCLFSCGYGLVRAIAFHPLARKGYLGWLRTTPWRPGMPLPLGPVAFAWWDAVVLGTLVLMVLRHPHVPIAFALLPFAIGYLIAAFLVLRTALPWCAYVIALGAAFGVRYFLSLACVEAIAAGLFVLAHGAMIWSLRGFPWEKDPSRQPPETFGWLSMVPQNTEPLVTARVAVAICAMVACWTWSILSVDDVQSQFSRTDAILLAILAAGVGSLFRCLRYWGSYRCAISPLARLRSGRLVIPGYDYMLLAPAMAPIAAGAVAIAVAMIGASEPSIIAAGVSTGLAVLLLAPPTFRDWQLTGFHRRSPFKKDSLAEAKQRASYPLLARIWPE